MMRIFTLFLTILTLSCALNAQIASHNLVGYWHNWNSVNAPYIQLDQVDNRYTIVEVAFAVPVSATDMTMQFTPSGGVSQASFITKIQTLKTRGKKVLLSVGGGGTTVELTTTANTTAFINSMTSLLQTYGFDGMDIDIEGGTSISNTTGGTITTPTNGAQTNLINAIKQVMKNYRSSNGNRKMLLTFAPETAYVQGGQSSFSTFWGGYLPTIDALRDSIDLLQVQLYNSGTMYGLDRRIYTQGTADFIVALTEALIRGFNTNGGAFQGFPASKVAVGLPACTGAAGGGVTPMSVVEASMKYLWGVGAKPSTYTLLAAGGYPTLNGMMTWSINWDATASNNYAATYQSALLALLTPVPVELVSFQATPLSKTVVLDWQTASERHADYFAVQRSSDGQKFEEMGRIKAIGNSNALQKYQLTDASPANGINYYRLRQIDIDGKETLSKVVSAVQNSAIGVQIFPNPTTDKVVITCSETLLDTPLSISVFDLLGRNLMRCSLANHSELDLSALSKGVYLVDIRTADGIFQGKVVKQ